MQNSAKTTGGGGGGGKSQFTYVGLNSSVTECSIEIIQNINTNKIKKYLCSFFSNEGSFSHLFDSLDSRIESNFIGLCLAIRISITFLLKIESSSFSDDRDIITCD